MNPRASLDDLKELVFNNNVVGISLVSIAHRPDLKTPVLLQAVNGFPIQPVSLKRAIELVVKVDGITEACRFDVIQRLRGKGLPSSRRTSTDTAR